MLNREISDAMTREGRNQLDFIFAISDYFFSSILLNIIPHSKKNFLIPKLYNKTSTMPKEDSQLTNPSLPIDLEFIPQTVQVEFKKKIKLQIAFFRNDKVCKSTLAKFNVQNCINGVLTLNRQPLQFCTTVIYNPTTQYFSSKKINVQLALQIDSQKQTFDAKIDLKDILTSYPLCERNALLITFKSNIKLVYSLKASVIQRNPATDFPSALSSGYIKQQHKEQSKKLQYANVQSKKTIKFKSSTLITEQDVNSPHDDNKQNQPTNCSSLKKFHSYKNINNIKQYPSNLNNPLHTLDHLQLQQKLTTTETHLQHSQLHNQSLKQKINDLEQQINQLSKNQQKILEENQLLKNKLKIIEPDAKQRSPNDRQKSAKKLRQQKKQSTQHNQQQLYHLKTIELEWKQKYHQLQKKYIKLIEDNQLNKHNLDKQKKQSEILTKRISLLQKQLSQLDQPQKPPQKQKDPQLQKLSKILQTKQQLIKMLKKQNQIKRNQKDDDIDILKKSNRGLKQQIQKLKDGKKQISTQLQLKILNQKLKKQCLEAKRQEKKMITQRFEIQCKNKQMQEEIVRLKQSLAKMLNIVQEQGSPDLFTQVADCIS